jgi:hypothetical protein
MCRSMIRFKRTVIVTLENLDECNVPIPFGLRECFVCHKPATRLLLADDPEFTAALNPDDQILANMILAAAGETDTEGFDTLLPLCDTCRELPN